MGYADLHIHSVYSYDGICKIPTILKYVAEQTDLDLIAVTDHDVIDGALEAERQSEAYGVQVVPGVEITAREGHILALYIRETVPAGLSALETVQRVGELGGLCIAAHPLARGVHGMNAETIRKVLDHPQAAPYLVGLETWNTGLVFQQSNYRVEKLARSLPVAQTGGSDSHVLFTIGHGVTEFHGRTARDLRRSLEMRTTRGLKRVDSPLAWIAVNWLSGLYRRKRGWAGI